MVITDATKLKTGAWYACGLRNLENAVEWGCAQIYQYVGDRCWLDDDGEPVDRLWDAELQLYVDINGADEYQEQC